MLICEIDLAYKPEIPKYYSMSQKSPSTEKVTQIETTNEIATLNFASNEMKQFN